MSILYIIATPIGNLEDITLRALRVLKEVDLILCEDTRQTKKLLDHYQISTPTLSYHQHSQLTKINYIVELLKSGKNLALVSDAGTPCISDPGSYLVRRVMESATAAGGVPPAGGKSQEVSVVPIPGPSAAISTASISGFDVDKFVFFGFLPHKKGRETLMKKIADSDYPIIFYESPHRILKTLNQLQKVLAVDRSIVVARELTKKFESVYRGTVQEVTEQLGKDVMKGEFVVVVNR